MVVVPGRIKLAPERDDFRVVDIEPVHALWRIDAKKAGVEPAPQMQHDGVGISGQKVPNADIQRLGPDGKADTEIVVDLEPGKIIIDLAHRRVGEVILEQRMGQPALQGLAFRASSARSLSLRSVLPFPQPCLCPFGCSRFYLGMGERKASFGWWQSVGRTIFAVKEILP